MEFVVIFGRFVNRVRACWWVAGFERVRFRGEKLDFFRVYFIGVFARSLEVLYRRNCRVEVVLGLM